MLGEREFFREFCREHQRAIWLAARQVVGEELAYDAAQETMCRLARQVEKLRQMSREELGAYVYLAARRNALNLAARERRHEHGELPELADGGGGPEERLMIKEGEEELCRALAGLPEMYREVLVLNVIECMSGREAAAELGISEAALRQRKKRALGLLRERLSGDKDEGGTEHGQA